jgi:hypothetical protein
MTGEVITEIMKKLLSTDRGVALVILVVAITITALIGAGITSFMASKKASEELPIYSYQAYTLAHAGVEFAIRYAHDNWIDFNLNSANYINNVTPNACTTLTGKPIYDSSTPPKVLFYLCCNDCSSGSTTNGWLTSIGVAGAAQKKIVLRNFRSYANH